MADYLRRLHCHRKLQILLNSAVSGRTEYWILTWGGGLVPPSTSDHCWVHCVPKISYNRVLNMRPSDIYWLHPCRAKSYKSMLNQTGHQHNAILSWAADSSLLFTNTDIITPTIGLSWTCNWASEEPSVSPRPASSAGQTFLPDGQAIHPYEKPWFLPLQAFCGSSWELTATSFW
jgi:hypothetical protein